MPQSIMLSSTRSYNTSGFDAINQYEDAPTRLKRKAKSRERLGLGVGAAYNKLLTSIGQHKGVGAVYNYNMSQKREKRFGQFTSPGGM
jgi:hypothetical protein